MLVLTRKKDESIVCTDSRTGTRIEFSLLDIRALSSGARARIGIDAPKHIVIHRDEVQQEIDDKVGPIPATQEH
ncbi:MAG: carbon storage regulator [Planctomycetota bacterium]